MKKTDKPYKTRTEIGHVMSLIQSLNSGESFYTSQEPKVVTRYAIQYNKKVKTERVLSIHSYSSDKPEASKLTKVTIL